MFTGNYHRSGDQDQIQEWGALRKTPSAMGGGEQTLTAEMGHTVRRLRGGSPVGDEIRNLS